MTCWEERMSQRAKARQAAQETAEREAREAWEQQEIAYWETVLPALPGERRVLHRYAFGDHLGHLEHTCGNTYTCSCGAISGVFTVVIPEDYVSTPCEICKTRKIGSFTQDAGGQPVTWPTAGGNWEGGFTDREGRRWVHIPNVGWRVDDRPPLYLAPVPRVPWWRRTLGR